MTFLTQLELVGILDEALVVVTADHGISFQSGVPSRGITDENAFEVGMVPLFIKAPHQDRGVVDIKTARNIDVLPTVADHLGIDLSWSHDGQSLLRAPRDSQPLTVQARAGGEVTLSGVEPGVRAAISHIRSLFGTNAGVLDPYSMGGYDSVVGTTHGRRVA